MTMRGRSDGPGYRRFIERRLREDFEFTGSPVVIGVRIREKRKR